jgi:hypothetical protein
MFERGPIGLKLETDWYGESVVVKVVCLNESVLNVLFLISSNPNPTLLTLILNLNLNLTLGLNLTLTLTPSTPGILANQSSPGNYWQSSPGDVLFWRGRGEHGSSRG